MGADKIKIMDRLAIINHFIRKNNYKSFLNIGVFTGYTLDGVDCLYKIGVDPERAHYKGNCGVIELTSDEYFATLRSETKFDCIFIDGMHLEEYVTRDIHNSLNHLNEGGVIILHDISPPTPNHASRTQILPEWNGDCYKAFIRFKMKFPEYPSYVIDTDWGCGVICNELHKEFVCDMPNEDIERMLEWDYFDSNRKSLLDLITVEEFKTKMDERTTDNNLPTQ